MKIETETIEELLEGSITAGEANERINQEIGGITSAEWNPGRGVYKIHNHTGYIQLPVIGASRRDQKKLQELAILAYLQAQRNESWKAGEIHISPEFSSKHHNFRERAQMIQAKYDRN